MDRVRNNKGKAAVIIILVIAVFLIAGAVAAWIFVMPGSISREKAVASYYEAISNEDVKLYKKACYTSKWEKNYGTDANGLSLDDSIKSAFAMQSGASYGDIKVTAMEKLDDSYAEKMTEKLSSIYGVDIKISAISKVNFSVKTKFEGAKVDSGTITRYCYKYMGKWYFMADPEIIIQIDLEG